MGTAQLRPGGGVHATCCQWARGGRRPRDCRRGCPWDVEQGLHRHSDGTACPSSQTPGISTHPRTLTPVSWPGSRGQVTLQQPVGAVRRPPGLGSPRGGLSRPPRCLGSLPACRGEADGLPTHQTSKSLRNRHICALNPTVVSEKERSQVWV